MIAFEWISFYLDHEEYLPPFETFIFFYSRSSLDNEHNEFVFHSRMTTLRDSTVPFYQFAKKFTPSFRKLQQVLSFSIDKDSLMVRKIAVSS